MMNSKGFLGNASGKKNSGFTYNYNQGSSSFSKGYFPTSNEEEK
jgi:hypothetical protein